MRSLPEFGSLLGDANPLIQSKRLVCPVCVSSVFHPWLKNESGSPARGGMIPLHGEGQRAVGVYLALAGEFLGADDLREGHVEAFAGIDEAELPVADAKFGLVYSGKRFDVSLTQVIRSKEFVGQREIDAYGALALSMKWDPPATRGTRGPPRN